MSTTSCRPITSAPPPGSPGRFAFCAMRMRPASLSLPNRLGFAVPRPSPPGAVKAEARDRTGVAERARVAAGDRQRDDALQRKLRLGVDDASISRRRQPELRACVEAARPNGAVVLDEHVGFLIAIELAHVGGAGERKCRTSTCYTRTGNRTPTPNTGVIAKSAVSADQFDRVIEAHHCRGQGFRR